MHLISSALREFRILKFRWNEDKILLFYERLTIRHRLAGRWLPANDAG